MDSPRGRLYLMRAAAEGRIGLSETFGHHLDLCLGCRACESACPSGVPFGSLLEATRAQFRRGAAPPSLFERLVFLVFPEHRHLSPGVKRDTARLLALAGWDVVIPPGQGCCGALDLHAGRLEEFRVRARALAASFPTDVEYVVTNAAGCGSAMKEYGHWLPD